MQDVKYQLGPASKVRYCVQKTMRLRLQFNLKSFLIATTLAGVLVGTIGNQVYLRWQSEVELQKALVRRQAARKSLINIGGHLKEEGDVIVSVQFPQRACRSKDFALLADLTGLENLDLSQSGFKDSDTPVLEAQKSVKRLTLAGNEQISDVGLVAIGKFDSLEVLDLSLTGISDEGLKTIGDARRLRGLGLAKTKVTSAGLSHLRDLQSLRSLNLAYTDVDDDALPAIGKLSGLRSLNLDGTKVSGTGLAALHNLKTLKTFHLHACPLQDGTGLAELDQVVELSLECELPDGFLRNIHKMENLRTLTLDGSVLKDSQLKELEDATQLTRLNLCRTAITDDGIIHLATLKSLKNVSLLDTRVTEDGARALAVQIPKTLIQTSHGSRKGLKPWERRELTKAN